MSELDQAVALLRALTGADGALGPDPYPWQARLLTERLLKGQTPAALDIPTGLGKTRVMALWLAARALGARLPRRLVYVVDRRAVVDQATVEAELLVKALPGALKALGPEREAEAWTALGLRLGAELPVSTLRGQHLDNRRWLDAPGGAAIVVGTVDMIGSRLLFSGYGVSRGMRPAHAGLLGCDTLVLLDEAHLVAPFEALVRRVAAEDRPAPTPRMRVMALSATGAAPEEADVFRLAGDDFEAQAVAQRLDAPKALKLHQAPDLVDALVQQALRRGEDEGGRIIVFCNQRDRGARDVAERLEKETRARWGGAARIGLLVGGRRLHERERDFGEGSVAAEFLAGRVRDVLAAPSFLVATSAGEVGVDLDADHMVCDLVPWERMVQRLGRVNRTGRPETALVDVFWSEAAPKDAKDKPEVETPVHDRLKLYRAPFESEAWPVAHDDDRRQAGPGELLRLRDDAAFRALAEAATTEAPLRPELTRAHAEAWAMTSLDDHPGRPRIEPWLRGWSDDAAQASLAWRALLSPRPNERLDQALVKALFEALPPHRSELLETDAWRITALVKARATAVLKRNDTVERTALDDLAAVLVKPNRELERRFGLAELAEFDAGRLTAAIAGRTLVLDARLGGLNDQGLLDAKAAAPPETADGGALKQPAWSVEELEAVGRRLRLVKLAKPDHEPDPETLEDDEAAALPEAGDEDADWVRLAGWPVQPTQDAPGHEWRVERLRGEPENGDPARSSAAQRLEEHLSWTEAAARDIAEALELEPACAAMLQLAARVHDLGKARELWQTAMGAERDGRPYAKTTGRRAVTALLNGYRHEFGSLKDAEAEFTEIADEDLRDLARHLVAAHHGHARPLIKPYDPAEPPSASALRAQEAALRFARLQRRWGPWGLAWWESLLRAADWAASRRNEGEGAIRG